MMYFTILLLLIFFGSIWLTLCIYQPRISFAFILVGVLTFRYWLSIDITGQNHFISIFDILFFAFVLIVVVKYMAYNRKIILPNDISLLLSIFLFFFAVIGFPIIGILLYNHSVAMITPSVRYFQWFLFLPLVIYLYFYNNLSHEYIMVPIAVAAILQVGYGFLQVLEFHELVTELPHHALLEGHDTETRYGSRSIGLFDNPNRYGFLMTLFTLLFFLHYSQEKYHIYLILALVSLLGIFLSESRTALVALILPLLLYYVLFSENQFLVFKYSMVFIPILTLLITLTDLGPSGRLSEIYMLLSGDFDQISSFAARFDNWNQAIETYRTESPTMVFIDVTGSPTDNYYLSLLIQSGIFGVGSLFMMYLFLMRWGLRLRSRIEENYSEIIFILIISILLANLTMSATDSPSVQILLWTYIGVLTATSSLQNPDVQIQTIRNSR